MTDPMIRRSEAPALQDRADLVLSTPLSTAILNGQKTLQSPLAKERPEIVVTEIDLHRDRPDETSH